MSSFCDDDKAAYPITYMCAVDGSTDANVAFEVSLDLLRPQDNLCLFHAYSPRKDELLPSHLKSNHLKDIYSTILECRLPGGNPSMLWENRHEKSVKLVLEEATKRYEPDFVVVGHTGRKAFNNTAHEETTCGSNADFTMRHFPCSCIIVKKQDLRSGARTYVYAVKNSALCRAGLDDLLRLLRPRDTLTVVYVDDGDYERVGDYSVADMRRYYESKMTHISVNSTFKVVENKAFATEQDTIVGLMNHVDADFCCLTPRIKDFTGSLTEKIITKVKGSIILLKPKVSPILR